MQVPNDLITIRQAAVLCNISRWWAYHYRTKYDWNQYILGGRTLYSQADVLAKTPKPDARREKANLARRAAAAKRWREYYARKQSDITTT